MIVGTATSILLNRHSRDEMFRGTFFLLNFVIVISPYLAVGVVSYKMRRSIAACVIGLVAAIGVTFFGIGLMVSFTSYGGGSSLGVGWAAGLTLIYQWGALVGITGTGLIVMFIRKLWHLS